MHIYISSVFWRISLKIKKKCKKKKLFEFSRREFDDCMNENKQEQSRIVWTPISESLKCFI